ncbi:MAG: BatA and WFA domain-containing protein, partial [Candidatus Sumerlaeota bacterium]|nr:BatA and WFA domain-containing protein [Candidatus Sumerlaeota bacterium]
MKFLFPLGFAFAAALPLIVLMYLLKLRRQKMVISSILLWRKSLEDLQANTPFQKLKNNLLLWLQLLAAALAVAALAHPIMKLAGRGGISYVVLVDTSASMKTREVEGVRIEQARATLETLVNNMARGDEMMVVGFDREPHVAQTFTRDRELLRAAARRLEARDAATLSYNAFALARSMAEKTARSVQIVLLSDGAIADLDRSPDAMPPVKFISIGETGENAGIVGLDLRQTFDREPDTQLFATVQNFGQQALSSLLECRLDGQLLDAKEIAAAAGQSASVIFSGLRGKAGRLELRLKSNDAFEADNVVYGVLSGGEELKILLVSSSNPFLSKLLALNPRYKLFQVAPGDYTSSEGYAVTV